MFKIEMVFIFFLFTLVIRINSVRFRLVEWKLLRTKFKFPVYCSKRLMLGHHPDFIDTVKYLMNEHSRFLY